MVYDLLWFRESNTFGMVYDLLWFKESNTFGMVYGLIWFKESARIFSKRGYRRFLVKDNPR